MEKRNNKEQKDTVHFACSYSACVAWSVWYILMLYNSVWLASGVAASLLIIFVLHDWFPDVVFGTRGNKVMDWLFAPALPKIGFVDGWVLFAIPPTVITCFVL